jgi:hypothetical protein
LVVVVVHLPCIGDEEKTRTYLLLVDLDIHVVILVVDLSKGKGTHFSQQ